MSKVMVRMSTLIKLSVHGKMKKRPAESQEWKHFNKGYACRNCNNEKSFSTNVDAGSGGRGAKSGSLPQAAAAPTASVKLWIFEAFTSPFQVMVMELAP